MQSTSVHQSDNSWPWVGVSVYVCVCARMCLSWIIKTQLKVCVLSICVEKKCQAGLGEGRRVAVHLLMDVKGHKWRKGRGS